MSNVTDDVAAETRRRFSRQHVLLKAKLDTGQYEFDCLAYDLSLNGVKLKLDLPLKTECEVQVNVKDSSLMPAVVIWSESGFIGLRFTLPPEKVASILGSLGTKLPKI